ncbi:MAG: hypothetical protein WAW96_18840 [Alphaproteobacteria bacterium]
MKRLANAAICGLVFALAGVCAAQADEPSATAAPKSLFGTNSAQGSHATVPYRAEMTAPTSDQQALPALRASAYGADAAQEEKVPAGMRITYKRARNGSFIKTYVAESGTN